MNMLYVRTNFIFGFICQDGSRTLRYPPLQRKESMTGCPREVEGDVWRQVALVCGHELKRESPEMAAEGAAAAPSASVVVLLCQ